MIDTKNQNESSNINQKSYPVNSGTQLKVTTDRKEELDDFVEFLKTAFDCELKSKKLYSEDQDKFFQYIAITKKGAK